MTNMIDLSLVRLNIPPLNNLSDDQIREIAWNNPNNGSYATKICKRCGLYWNAPDGNAKTATIIDKCRDCFDTPNDVLLKFQLAQS
jgi:hypothetical protein